MWNCENRLVIIWYCEVHLVYYVTNGKEVQLSCNCVLNSSISNLPNIYSPHSMDRVKKFFPTGLSHARLDASPRCNKACNVTMYLILNTCRSDSALFYFAV